MAGHRGQFIPVMPHLGGNAPDEGYFFSKPLLETVDAAAAGEYSWRYLAYHPTEPVLAIVAERYETEPPMAFIFQPTGGGILEAGDHAEATVMEAGNDAWRLTWSPAGDVFAYFEWPQSGGGTVVFRAYPGGETLHRFTLEGFTPGIVQFSPDGSRVYVGGYAGNANQHHVIETRTGKSVASLGAVPFKPYGFTPDGEHLIGTGDVLDQPMIEKGEQDTIYTWKVGVDERELLTQAFEPQDNGLSRAVGTLAFSPNGRFLVAVGHDGELRVWDGLGE